MEFQSVPNSLVQKRGLEKIVKHNHKYHCAVVSSFDVMATNDDEYIKQRKFHCKSLAKIQGHVSLVIAVKGIWIDDIGDIHKEEGFLIVDDSDTLKEFESLMKWLVEKDGKDTVVIIPKNTLSSKGKKNLIC